MNKVFKDSKIAVLSLILLIVIAGYVNYEYNPEREENLGQTMYVNNNVDTTNIDIYQSSSISDSNEKEVYQYAKEDDSISVFKLDRDNMFSEISDNYRQIISNTNTDTEMITEYQIKLDELLAKKNLIVMVENIIKSNGIEDVVIIPTNNDSFNIILKAKEELKEEVVEKIKEIIINQFNIGGDKINITVQEN